MLLQTKTLRVLALRTAETVELEMSARGLCVSDVRDESCQTKPLP